ncbi:MAG: M48 family metalloprotease, partial [Candidatus Omnitrophica bacterium]|nr:M48 family metalloprotease [Candidatus Omnitrophota bacterium]
MGPDAEAKTYQKIKYRVFALDLFLGLAFPALIQFSGLSHGWSAFAVSISEKKWLQVLAYQTLFFHAIFLLSLPLGYYSSFVLEHRFRLSRHTLSSWVGDKFKGYLLSLAFYLAVLECFYGLIHFYLRAWWILAGLGWFLVTVAIARIFPVWVIPLFYRTQPLKDAVLEKSMGILCEKCGLRGVRAYEIALSMKTKKANAALVGIGKSRRILLGDTLLRSFSTPEIETVVAHEIGHHVRRHILKSLGLNFMFSLGGFWLLFFFSGSVVGFFGGQGLEDLSIFPALLFLAACGGILLLPWQNAISRHYENEADRFALTLYPSLETFSSLLEKLGRQNLSDPDPP